MFLLRPGLPARPWLLPSVFRKPEYCGQVNLTAFRQAGTIAAGMKGGDRMTIVTTAQRKLFLVYDEVVRVPNLKRGGEYPFRVRVWMGKGQAPVALVSKPPDSDVPPSWMCSRVANRVFRDYLRKPREFRYYEAQYSKPEDSESLVRAGVMEVLFEKTGPIDGPTLVKPITKYRTWNDLEWLVGEPITDLD
jgi:hypothetical protein